MSNKQTVRTYAQQQTFVLLDGAQAAQEPRHHDDGAQGDDQVGGGQRGEGGRQRGKAALRHGQPHAHAQEPTATQLWGGGDAERDRLISHTPMSSHMGVGGST